jgi:hypothetical protein
MIGNLIVGLLVIGGGGLLVFKAETFLNNFGRLPFFENHLATSGGSRLGYKLIGIVLLIIGFMIATGLIGGFITWLISPLTKYSQPI